MDLYEEDFPFYLKFTNEKKVLASEIRALFKKLNVKSVLDIGAGNGDLSSLLFREVNQYTAIEPKPEFAKSLRDKGINVIEKAFPCDLGKEKYDFVLCSHSAPYSREDYKPFIEEAIKRLNNTGDLLIITYIGEGEDWNNFMEEIGVKTFEDTLSRYIERKNFLKQFRMLKEWFVFSKLESSSIDDLIRALSFVASGGEKEKRDTFFSKIEKIKNILNLRYYDPKFKRYFFPFKHVFLMGSGMNGPTRN